jgi:hypothetical protein
LYAVIGEKPVSQIPAISIQNEIGNDGANCFGVLEMLLQFLASTAVYDTVSARRIS